MNLSRIAPMCGVAALLLACGGTPSAPDVDIDPELGAQIASVMAPFGAYEIEGDEGPEGDWYEVGALSTVDIYFDADGAIPKFEVEVPLELLPEPVRQAAGAEIGVGDTLSGVELVYWDGTFMWEVEIETADGAERDLYYLPDGTLDHEDD